MAQTGSKISTNSTQVKVGGKQEYGFAPYARANTQEIELYTRDRQSNFT